jgi:hypothetical protein
VLLERKRKIWRGESEWWQRKGREREGMGKKKKKKKLTTKLPLESALN